MSLTVYISLNIAVLRSQNRKYLNTSKKIKIKSEPRIHKYIELINIKLWKLSLISMCNVKKVVLYYS